MEVKEAVRIAKAYVVDLLSDESAKNLGLEGIEFDEAGRTWNVTIGFSRPWDMPRPSSAFQEALEVPKRREPPRRDYKTVTVRDTDGKVISLRPFETLN